MYEYENNLSHQGLLNIAGVDEAGRGPLAGPVVAAAVILPKEKIEGINDSKKLSEKKREKLFSILLEKASVGVGVINRKTIDRINILEAAKLAMKVAVEDLTHQPDYVLVDGKNMNLNIKSPQLSIISGDKLSASIAAASIIAKVTRDRLMITLDKFYPEYQLAKHKGYPTKLHIELLDQFGPSRLHRKSFGPVKERLKLHVTN